MTMIQRHIVFALPLIGAILLGPARLSAADSQAAVPPGQGSQTAPGRTPRDASAPEKLIVRGWEIQSVTGIERATVSEIYPEYANKKPVGNRTEAKRPAKDKYLVVLVQSQSATLQSLNQPLWVGLPDVTLVDDVGFEYPALGRLVQLTGDYVAVGMVAGRNRARGARSTDNSLVYFDVPASAHVFWLKFSEGGPLIAVNTAKDLPVVATE